MLDGIRQGMTDVQSDILNTIWDYYQEEAEWIPTRLLHHTFGKSKVLSETQRLGGSIVVQTDEPRQSRYMLAFLGVLLTKGGEEVEDILVEYLKHIRQRFLDDPLIEAIHRVEVAVALGLSEGSSQFLFNLIDIAHFWGGSATHSQDDWSAGVPDDIDELPEVSDLRHHVRSRALKDYDPDVPVRGIEKFGYIWSKARESEPRSEFWFILDIDLQKQIEVDWGEARKCIDVKAWKACTVMCASVLEGMLLDVLGRMEAKAQNICKERGLRSKGKDIEEWILSDMVIVARGMGVIGRESTHLLDAIRGFRNLIHPGRRLRGAARVTQPKARLAIEMVGVISEELALFDETKIGTPQSR